MNVIPTAITREERTKLVQLARNRVVMEIGALFGYSTIAMAEVASRVISIDPHEGYPTNNPRPTIAPFLANLRDCGVRDNVTVILEPWDKVCGLFRGKSADLVFIDMTGEYRDTLQALYNVQDNLEWGAIAVHDMGNPDWPGAEQAVQDFVSREKKKVVTTGGLAVIT